MTRPMPRVIIGKLPTCTICRFYHEDRPEGQCFADPGDAKFVNKNRPACRMWEPKMYVNLDEEIAATRSSLRSLEETERATKKTP